MVWYVPVLGDWCLEMVASALGIEAFVGGELRWHF